jgi:hypothetical protein
MRFLRKETIMGSDYKRVQAKTTRKLQRLKTWRQLFADAGMDVSDFDATIDQLETGLRNIQAHSPCCSLALVRGYLGCLKIELSIRELATRQT